MNMVRNALVAAVMAGSLGFCFVPAQAGPVPGPSSMSLPVVDPGVPGIEQVQYRHRGWRNHRRGPRVYFGFGNRRSGHYRPRQNRYRSW